MTVDFFKKNSQTPEMSFPSTSMIAPLDRCQALA